MSTFQATNGKSIQEAFDAFHAANPAVWREVKRLAFLAIDKGRTRISFNLIVDVIRWQSFITTDEPNPVTVDGQKIRLSDHYSSRYARLFAKEYPEHADKIEFRKLRSERGRRSAPPAMSEYREQSLF